MNYLSAERLTKTFGDKWLFQDISFGIQKGEKVALVGGNGTGKSTLLKVVTQTLMPDEGTASLRKEIKVAHLLQNPDLNESLTILECLYDPHNPIARTAQAYAKYLETGASDDKMQHLMEEMEALNAWDFDSKVMQVAAKLGVGNFDQQVDTLSGGQKKRIALAQMLLSGADFLIFDEPTNHLDINAIEWLEKYLSAENITLLMVSHDRYFVDNVANVILELDHGKLYTHRGNYSKYLENKALRYEVEAIEVSKAKQLYKKELEWMRRQPKARGTKAQYRIDAFAEVKKKAKKDISKDQIILNIKETRQGKNVIEVKNIGKSFNGEKVINDFSYVFNRHQKIGIVGKNGSGKSTLLNILSKKLMPDQGTVIKGETTKIGYFTQNATNLNEANRVIDEVKAIAEYITVADGKHLTASKLLETFLFDGKKQYSYISKLSGGEKKRLQLLKILIENPNFLILDEPTNDLDIDTLNVLEEFLLQFGGCLLLVSHDRYFMDHLVEDIFVLEGDGEINIYNGNYSNYLNKKAEKSAIETIGQTSRTKASQTKNKEQFKGKTQSQKLSFNEQREYEQLESQIEKLESEKDALMKLLTSGEDNHEKLSAWSEKIGILDQQIEEKTNRWMLYEERLSFN